MERCAYCPTDEERANRPAIARELTCTLLCGHIVHTHCLMFEMFESANSTCRTCNLNVIPEDIEVFYRNRRANRLRELWQNSEVFREDVKEVDKLRKNFAKYTKSYNSELTKIKNNFKESTKLPIGLIKQEQRNSLNAVKTIPNRREYLVANTRLRNKTRQFSATYDTSYYELSRVFNTIEGAPKFPRNYGLAYRFRTLSRYMFYVRI